jgi:hypothetical protein
MKDKNLLKFIDFFYYFIILFFIFIPISYLSANLSCSLTTALGCTGTTILRLSGSTNAHGELPNQSHFNYDNNVVCCTSVSNIGNSCSGNYVVVGKLSAVTNAHIEENSYSNFSQNVCLSDSSIGDEIVFGYQDNNCNGYDTTLFSLSASQNATLGGSTAYTRKACASVIPLSISFSISDNLVGFGTLSSLTSRYATGDGLGSNTEVEAHTISANTNASGGYSIYLSGSTLTSGSYTINSIGGINSSPTPGTEQFGLRASVTSGTGNVSSPYSASGFAFDQASFPDEIASGTGDDQVTVYSLRYLGNINQNTEAGNYQASLNYIMTGTF